MRGRSPAAGLLGGFLLRVIECIANCGDFFLRHRLASDLLEGLAASGEECLAWAIVVGHVWRQGLTVAMFVLDGCRNLG